MHIHFETRIRQYMAHYTSCCSIYLSLVCLWQALLRLKLLLELSILLILLSLVIKQMVLATNLIKHDLVVVGSYLLIMTMIHTCIYMCVHTLKECKQNGLLMLLLLLSLYCMTCVLMTYMTGALFIAVVAGDVSIRSGSNFTANTAPNGGMFR